MDRRRFTAACIAALSAQTLPAGAQSGYPSRPLRLVVPYPAGGSTDMLGRLIGAKLGDALGQRVVVENRPGANGNIGTESIARSPADGYSILIGGAANTINHTLYRNLSFDITKDLIPFAMIGIVPNIMVVPNSLPVKTPQEFIAWAKANAPSVNYASSGNGATTHMSAELFKMVTGTPMTHVPYKGSAPALTDLIAGRTQVMFDNIASALQQVKAGQLRALALTGPDRSPAIPELPTLKELGIAVETTSWFGLFVPAGTPGDIVERLNREVRRIVVQPEVKAQLTQLGAESRDWSVAQLQDYTRAEVEKWAKVIQVSGAKVD
jgi:tripartite-type tricarboxylate transporter receptor subunit TctC